MKRLAGIVAVAIAYVGWLGVGEGWTATCGTVIQGHVDWLLAAPTPGTERKLYFVLVSNRGQTFLNIGPPLRATYMEGELEGKYTLLGPVLQGNGTTYYSDKRWCLDPIDGELFTTCSDTPPFDPDESQDWRLTLLKANNSATLSRSGSTSIKIDQLQCLTSQPGLAWGDSYASGAKTPVTKFIISFKRDESPVITVPK